MKFLTCYHLKNDINKIYPLLEIKNCKGMYIGDYIECTFENKIKIKISFNKSNN